MSFTERKMQFIHRHEIFSKIILAFALLVALMEIGCMTSFLGDEDLVSHKFFYAFFCLTPVVLLVVSRRFTVNRLLLLFCAVAGISLILNHPVDNFMSVLRFCFFCGMLCLLSPIINSNFIRQFRNYLWKCMIILVQILVILSILLYAKTALFDDHGRLFLVVKHPILLSTLSGFTAVVVSFRLLRGNYKSSAEKGHGAIIGRSGIISRAAIIFDVVSFVAAVLVMIWGGSRGAILGFVVAEIYLIVVYKDRWKKMRWLLLGLISSIVVISVIGGDVTFRVKKKFEIGYENNSIIFSRKQLWQSRIEEFAEKPIFGIGFTNYTRLSTLYDNRVVQEKQRGIYDEPGSSWLTVLSNTGILGFGIMMVWTVGLFVVVRRRRKRGDEVAPMYGGLMILMIVCGFFEGWLLYAGSINFFLYWLLTSQVLDCADSRLLVNKSLKGSCRI